jgi:cytoskeleton protein RodZ
MDPQETLGSYLRALREARSGSLADMSLATRVGVGQLEALEADKLADLPAPVFVRGFIRAYCHFLGQRSDEALRRYGAVVGADQPFERARPPSRPAISSSASPIVISLVLLIVLGGGLLALKLGVTHRSAPPVITVAPMVTVEPAINPVPMAPPAPPITVEPAAARSPVPASLMPSSTAGQRLTVKAIELTWLRIQTDDGTAAEAMLLPGATREWTAEKRFLLTLGNAGGVELLLNGQPVPLPDAKGAVIRELRLPQAGVPAGS